MKQYTTPEQTAKLIELGLPRPKMSAPKLEWQNEVLNKNFSAQCSPMD